MLDEWEGLPMFVRLLMNDCSFYNGKDHVLQILIFE